MDKNTVLWTVVVFFGASVIFMAIQRGFDDEGTVTIVLVEVVALALMVAAVVWFVRSGR